MNTWIESMQEYYKTNYPHEAPPNSDALKPFNCINCGELCKDELFGQKVCIKQPVLFPNMFDYLLDDHINGIYASASVCFKGEIVVP